MRFRFLTALLAFLVLLAAPALARPVIEIVAFGVSDELDVFRREAEQGAARLAHYLGARAPVVRVNRRGRAEAGPAALRAAVSAAGARLDRDKDILVVFLIAHGTRAGLMVKAGKRSETLSPADLGAILAASGVKHRIVIVSACYSGVFADALAGPETMVLTASDPWNPSFGCKPGARWTFFGEALFEKAMPAGGDWAAIFARTREHVAMLEDQRKYKPSNPQMAGGEAVLARLRDEAPPAQAASPVRQRCELRPEPSRENTQCLVFNGYSAGKLVGFFRLAAKRPVAAGGACAPDMPPGTLLAPDRLRVEGKVYTLFPDCKGAARTSD